MPPAGTGENGRANGHAAPAPARPANAPRRKDVRFGLMDVVWFPLRLVMRIFFPKMVDRYVIGELLGPLIFGWTMFIVLFVFSLNLVKLGQLAAAGASMDTIGEMLWLRVILSSVMCLPMAMLLSGLLSFGRLSGDSELIATQAGGIPNTRLIRNAVLLGLVLSFVGLAMNEYVIPKAGTRLKIVEAQVKKQVTAKVIEEVLDKRPFMETETDDKGQIVRLIVAKKFQPPSPPYPATMQDVTYVQYDKGKVQLMLEAERAELVGPDTKNEGLQEWKFVNADVRSLSPKNGNWMRMHSAEEFISLEKAAEPKKPEKLRDPAEMSYRDLKDYIKMMRRAGVREKRLRPMRVELQRKLSVPFAAVILALIGASLGIRRQRSTAGVGIGLSLLIIIIYYIAMSVFGVMGENGKLGTREAAWACNVIGLFAGLFLAWRSSR